jgi:GAF domain-containing protein
MPASMESKIHSTWDDGVSSLVLLSGESLIIHGKGLEQFKVARFAKAALIVPIKARDRPIGVISVVREQDHPFSEANQRMLQAVADYAAISLVNARLFQALAGRADRLEEEVTQTRTGLQDQRSFVENSSRVLRAALDQITRLLRSVEEQQHRDGLHVLQGDLETLLEQFELPSSTDN